MNTIALWLSVTSLTVVIGTWIKYLRTISQMKVPLKPTGTIVLQCVGIGLAVLGIILNIQGNGFFSMVVFVSAIFSLIMGLAFLLFYAQRKTPIGDLKVRVGDKLLPFAAMTSDGATFHSDELAGKRILLKFFRGAW